MRTSLDLCVCLLTLCGITPGLTGPGVKVVVEEDSDAVLPCSLNTKEDITGKVSFWKKDGRQVVFFYDSGFHSNNRFTGQDEQFKGRVSHFQDQLKNGNASIKIHNTNVADSGTYSCIFLRLQPRQTFNIELVVERLLRDRSGEIPGASPKPHITTLYDTKDWSLLQCEVRGAFPKPKVEWQDSAGNILPAEEPQVSERGGRYYVTLNTTVNKTGCYHCVATQEDINHQIHAETCVKLNGASPEPDITTLDVTKYRSLLQCEVRGASPKHKVEWQDRAGNILPAEEPQVSERGGSYYVTLNTTVNKTGCYHCVATQEEINHQMHAETCVKLNEAVKYWWWAAILIVLVVGLLLVPVLHLVFGIVSCMLCLVPGQDDRDRVVSPFGLGQFLAFSSAFPLDQFLNFPSGACGGGGGDDGCDDGCDGGCDE